MDDSNLNGSSAVQRVFAVGHYCLEIVVMSLHDVGP